MPNKSSSYKEVRKEKIGCIFFMLLLFFNQGFGQTKTYLKGGVTGNRAEMAALGAGTAVISSPLLSYGTPGGLSGFYYESNILNDLTTTATAATMTTYRAGVTIVAAGANTYIQFRNTSNANMPAGKSVFIKLNTPIVSTGVSVSVTGLLSLSGNKPLEGVLLTGAGNYSTATIGATEAAGTPGATTAFKTEMLLDKTGSWHAAIHPLNKALSYNSARLKLKLDGGLLELLGNKTLTMNVHNAFYIGTSGSICNINPMFVTRGEVNGIALDLGSVSPTLSLDTVISSPQSAIDSNSATYCAFQSGLLSLGALTNVSQSYLFDHTTTTGDGLRLQMSFPSSTLTVALLNNVTVSFYRNDTLQSTDTLGKRMLGVDLLTLPLLSGSFRSIDAVLRSTSTFDRATLNLGGGILSVSLAGSSIRVHEVSIAPAAPAISVQPEGDTVCQGEPLALSVTATSASSYQWQVLNSGTWTDIGSATSSTYTTTSTLLMNGNNYRVRVTGGGSCPQTVNSGNVLVGVKSRPAIPPITFGP